MNLNLPQIYLITGRYSNEGFAKEKKILSQMKNQSKKIEAN